MLRTEVRQHEVLNDNSFCHLSLACLADLPDIASATGGRQAGARKPGQASVTCHF